MSVIPVKREIITCLHYMLKLPIKILLTNFLEVGALSHTRALMGEIDKDRCTTESEPCFSSFKCPPVKHFQRQPHFHGNFSHILCYKFAIQIQVAPVCINSVRFELISYRDVFLQVSAASQAIFHPLFPPVWASFFLQI